MAIDEVDSSNSFVVVAAAAVSVWPLPMVSGVCPGWLCVCLHYGLLLLVVVVNYFFLLGYICGTSIKLVIRAAIALALSYSICMAQQCASGPRVD